MQVNLNLANALVNLNQWDEAVLYYHKALDLDPNQEEAHRNLGIALISSGKSDAALSCLLQATKLNPNDAYAYSKLGLAYANLGNVSLAIAYYEKSIQLAPDSPETLNQLAWIRAANENPAFRNGAVAVQLARKACELTGYKEPDALETLAAACAEAGDFTNAIINATKARDLARASSQTGLATRSQERLQLYQGGLPYHETAGSPDRPIR